MPLVRLVTCSDGVKAQAAPETNADLKSSLVFMVVALDDNIKL